MFNAWMRTALDQVRSGNVERGAVVDFDCVPATKDRGRIPDTSSRRSTAWMQR
jgi:hypothetical protein